ncbi:Ig-like domain-containing protein [Legionella saoudiensis]|uniref:Ig-like domain-containing protein n=1 Tax=Legionella saoudiensis TaxID=1750561 RepID=UPI0007311A35|nr:Ig-like domain-containing protein [Legionella saoudiensis]
MLEKVFKKDNLFRRCVAATLLYCQLVPIAGAAVAPTTPISPNSSLYYQTNKSAINKTPVQTEALNNLSLTNNQLGLKGPLDWGLTYSDLTGTFFNAQYVLPLGERLALGALGEYGANQYRINGTLGYSFNPLSQFKASVERLGQRLPFEFDSGSINARVNQMAYGGRFQQLLNANWLQEFNVGGYWAQAENKNLNPVLFTSNGVNCAGFSAGLTCINFRHLAGARSKGLDAGIDLLLTPATFIQTNLYYDQVHYRREFKTVNINPVKDRSGLGVGFKIDQLLGERFKVLGEASLREIYDTYQAGFSFIPSWGVASEVSVVGQHLVSHNATPNNSSISINLSLFGDKPKHYNKRARGEVVGNNIAQWVRSPAVKMDQVLAVAEQITKLVAPTISGVAPDSGPIVGGNSVTITGTNFVQGLLVFFGGQLATNIQVLSSTSIRVVVPPISNSSGGAVDVVVQNPDGQKSLLTNGYTYLGSNLPVIYSISPTQGSIAGGTTITITGANLATTQSVNFGGIPGTIVQVTDTQVSVISPPNIEGEVPITLTTSSGSVSKPNAYTYTAAPTITQQPVNQSASVGSTASFSAEATGTPTPTVQWQRSIDGVNWVDISGANLTTYTTPTLSISDNGSQYRAVFTNEIGQAVTNAALLTVSQPPPPTPILTDVISNVAPTGPINNGGTTNDTQPTFSGTAEAGDLISVYDGSTLIGTTTAAADGSWTFTPPIPLAEGAHSFTFTATNAGGSTSTPTAPFNFTVDTTAPAAPVLLALTSNVPPNQGPIANNGFTNDTQPIANGTAEAGTVISIFDNGSLIGTTPVDVAGNWTFMSPALAEGTHFFTFTATDAAGNISPQTVPFIFTVDTTPPAVPVLSDVTSHVSPVGSIANGGTTRDTQPTFSGSAEPGAVITASNSNIVMGETTVGADGSWTFTPLTPLSDNTYSFTFTATDSAGNTSGQTAPFIFTVDTVPPPVPVISSVMDNVPPNTGVITNGGITNDPQPVFSGTAQANAIITAMDGGIVIGTTTVDAGGNWIFTPPTLTEGSHVFTFTATDDIGNVSPASAPFTFTVDTLAPNAPTVSVTTTSGPISDGDSTNDAQPIFSGTAEPGAIITITDGVDIIGTTIVGADGNWAFTPGDPLTLGSHTLLFTATDAAGNISPASTFSLTIT